jgi:hypothetical protein
VCQKKKKKATSGILFLKHKLELSVTAENVDQKAFSQFILLKNTTTKYIFLYSLLGHCMHKSHFYSIIHTTKITIIISII